jgi:UDP-N-acetylmuramate dehydrogenase
MNLTFLKDLNLAVEFDACLARYTTFRLGGICTALIMCREACELQRTVAALHRKEVPFVLMGFGSNILASDKGLPRVVIRYSNNTPTIITSPLPGRGEVFVDAATQLDDLAAFACRNGLAGITSMSGIPGTVGGGIAGNAGAYGEQITDHLVSLQLLHPDGRTVRTVPKDHIHFSYRDSELKYNSDIILGATFDLKVGGNAADLITKRNAIIATRESKHGNWHENPCAGSFFRNVEPTSKAGPRQSAGWFLDQAGAKSLRVGGAFPYVKHANIVTHNSRANALDVYELTLKMAAAVKEKFGLELVREVRLLGEFSGAPAGNKAGFW